MKVAFIHDHFFLEHDDKYYSNGKFTYEKLKYYLKFGDHLTVIGRSKKINYKPESDYLSNGENIDVISLPSPISKDGILKRKELRERYKKILTGIDLVICRLPSEHGIICNEIAQDLGIKLINEMVASPFDCLWNRGDFAAKLYAPILSYKIKKTLLKSPVTIYVTNEYLQKEYPSTGKHIAISDVEINYIGDLKKLVAKDKYKLGVIADPALKLKGISILKKLASENKNVIFSIVGGSNKSELERELSEFSNIEQKGIIASKKELLEWINTLDLYIQPSLTEGLPRSVIEAMSCGVPVLASNVGGIPELVNIKLLFDKNDHKQANAIIKKLITSADYYSDMSEYSLDIARRYVNSSDDTKFNFIKDMTDS